MENESIMRNVNELREEVSSLRGIVENISLLLNKKLIKELYKEAEKIKKGEYYTKEEFMKRNHLKSG